MSKAEKYPVVEIFGPTIQGEGVDQGVSCHFVRFGGCDYKCDWCDSLYAVLPQHVRQAQRMSPLEIIDKLRELPSSPDWVILSGGNPALHSLSPLVAMLHLHGFFVAVETQGTKWRNWLWNCDRISVSPKPPSSGHITNFDQLGLFLRELDSERAFLKVVVLDRNDYEFAKKVHQEFPGFSMFVSACNDAGPTVGNPTRVDPRSDHQVALDLIDRGRTLANWVMIDSEMADVKVQMQQHVLYWGNGRGH